MSICVLSLPGAHACSESGRNEMVGSKVVHVQTLENAPLIDLLPGCNLQDLPRCKFNAAEVAVEGIWYNEAPCRTFLADVSGAVPWCHNVCMLFVVPNDCVGTCSCMVQTSGLPDNLRAAFERTLGELNTDAVLAKAAARDLWLPPPLDPIPEHAARSPPPPPPPPHLASPRLIGSSSWIEHVSLHCLQSDRWLTAVMKDAWYIRRM